ncbi:RNA polymerase II transcription factor B 52 kDa subunit [Knufia obscura]|uniref:RNA polymerase II transcription factor B subunit 2 n=1 Tax=Knufia obscura TaxID=1635080 RepID=A0ABR0RPC8_9EURO|nr:RNA polymerase II transcription factor B 52 kDa subunit [Knufia obscura]
MAESLQSWGYLEELQGVELQKLYKSPPSALAIFRKLLSGLSKHFVMSMLYCPRPTPLAEFELMVKASHAKDRQMALDQLRRYHIMRETTLKSGKALTLVPEFAKSLRQVLGGGGSGYSFGQVITPPSSEAVSVEDLDDYARQQWEGILGYMVGSSNLAELQQPGEELVPPSQGVIELLKAGSLITVHGTASRGQIPTITKDGFAFVLKDVNTQIWALLFLYVDNADAFEMDKIEVLSFIFFVASLELGLAYSTSTLTKTEKQILQDLLGLGIVYQPNPTAPYFYPTRLATTLTSSSTTALTTASQTLGSSLQPNSDLSAVHNTSPHQTPGSGFIIIETNFRLYAYTSSSLQIALLSLFIALRSRHPNMVTGKMTKQSVQRAIQTGITAEQIISYLATHAHPQMKRYAAAELSRNQARQVALNASSAGVTPEATANATLQLKVIPDTIMDQISLWQMERDRITSNVGFLLKDFSSQSEYADICRYADETGVLLWSDDKRRCFFVTRVEGVQSFIKERRVREQARMGA